MPLDKIAADALIYAGGAAFSALVSSGNNAWSASENRKSSESISRLNRDSSEEIARLSRKHSAELQYNQLKFSVLQQRENQEFQRELAELNHERAKEIEAFRAQVNFAINQKNLDFQKWRFEQEKKIQYDILQLQQDFQRDLTQIQHQNALIQMRERLREDKSPIANLASDLLENSFAHGIMPLKVLLAPPSLDYDPSSGKPYQASYEGFLSKEIEQFLHQGYLNSKQYPVQLLDKAWESNKRGGGSALQALHAQLKSIPILVLESEIPLGELNFRAGYWSGGDVSYTQATILSGQSVADLLNNSAKKRALEWEITRQKLQALGKDEAYIKNMGGVNEENLQIHNRELAEKEELEKHGIDTSNLPIGKEYKITDQDYKSFYEYLAVWHCLVIGLYADILFLGNSWENTPLLPSLIPYLLEKYKNHSFLTSEFWQMGISTVVKAYGQFYDTLKSDAPSCLPEIRMKLALSLANLPSEYQYLALEQGNKAFSDWLRANDAPSDKVFDLDNDADCQLLKRIIYQEDKPFLESLKLLLEKVKDADGVDGSQSAGINSLLAGWQLLNRFGNIPHLPALAAAGEPMIVEEKLKTSKQNPADNFTEMLPGDLALEMISIPAGEFMMGSDGYNDFKHKYYLQSFPDHDAASPIHKVKVPAFHMGKYPITQAQYEAVMGDNPSKYVPDYSRPDNIEHCGYPRNGADNVIKSFPYRPVNFVSWSMAQEFCQKLSELTGKKYQLPTESQWEYACRAGTTTKHFFGDMCEYIAKYGLISVCQYNSKRGYEKLRDIRDTDIVGQKKPNPWGLYDLLGNVWEWCQDDWIDGYYGHPSDGSAVNTESNVKVVRGGCFSSSQNDCCSFSRSSRRNHINCVDHTIGFRVVCVP
ncbi:formylglycine-generating enzyme family protein [Microcystis aeruginosa CS-1036]|uniref:formylglycine-generating enzyme family protein n=1 Tax=Microcystis aeruginosa TaxID=1126 RepID=UPI00232C5357|nr:formylglycine-generating enzyme family protein [Microcystis aeruginosa]MDB9545294.1 formylglycine-generating enzyme family protein [Microcystis aeruginosa CS-1036]